MIHNSQKLDGVAFSSIPTTLEEGPVAPSLAPVASEDTLLQDLNQIEQKAAAPSATSGQEVEVKKDSETKGEVDIYEMIAKLGGPSKEVIEAEKANGSIISALALSPTEIYLYKALSRQFWMVIKSKLGQSERMTEDLMREEILKRTVLWTSEHPSTDQFIASLPSTRAGLVDCLYTAVMTSSYFLDESVVVSLIQPL